MTSERMKYLKSACESVLKELERVEKTGGFDPEAFDQGNSKNDWIAYLNAYSGRAAEKVFRNERENQDFRENMVKAAGLCISAIAAFDRGWLKPSK